MATDYGASKRGYVQSYRIEATVWPPYDTYYFEATISDDEDGLTSPETWGLPRINVSTGLDINLNGQRYAISYANTHQGIIATVKDALQNGNQVLFEGIAIGTTTVTTAPADVNIDVPQGAGRRIPIEIPPVGPFPVEADEAEAIGSTIRDARIPDFELRQVTIFK